MKFAHDMKDRRSYWDRVLEAQGYRNIVISDDGNMIQWRGVGYRHRHKEDPLCAPVQNVWSDVSGLTIRVSRWKHRSTVTEGEGWLSAPDRIEGLRVLSEIGRRTW